MPSTVLGITLYVFGLGPGLAFAFAREGHRPAAKRSVFRETAAVILVSAVCDSIVGLFAVLVSMFWPAFAAAIRALLAGNSRWLVANFQVVVLSIVAALLLASTIGFILGTKKLNDAGLGRLWDNSLVARDASAWSTSFTKYTDTVVHLGIQLKSGGWLEGTLFTFDNSADPEPHRTITLTGEITYRAPGSESSSVVTGFGLVIVEAQDIEVLYVAYVENGSK